MYYPVCGMVHIKEPFLLIKKSSLCGGSGFPFLLSEGSFTICSGVARCQKLGGGGGAHRHVIYVPSVKNQYKRVVFGCMVICTAICVSLLKLSTR